MEWMLLKEGWLCWLDMVGSAGEKPKAAGWQRVEEGGLHPELLPPSQRKRGRKKIKEHIRCYIVNGKKILPQKSYPEENGQ